MGGVFVFLGPALCRKHTKIIAGPLSLQNRLSLGILTAPCSSSNSSGNRGNSGGRGGSGSGGGDCSGGYVELVVVE